MAVGWLLSFVFCLQLREYIDDTEDYINIQVLDLEIFVAFKYCQNLVKTLQYFAALRRFQALPSCYTKMEIVMYS
jgi:hypothetical protein